MIIPGISPNFALSSSEISANKDLINTEKEVKVQYDEYIALFESSSESVSMYNSSYESAELYVDGSIMFPPEKVPTQEVLPIVDKLKFEPGYKEVELELVDQYIGRKIRVNMLSGKVYEGSLGSVTKYNLELTQNLAGGVINYPLMLSEIKTFEVWFNQE